jgi:glucose/arabinose dehydrogenase/mono/diheme cytochrome c family protein
MATAHAFRVAAVIGSLVVLTFGGHSPLALVRAGDKPAPLDVELDDLRPGLVASYRSLADKEAVVHRVDPKPAFYVGHSSPHPRIGHGPFEVVWQGILFFKETGPVSFDALVGGEVTMEIDGVTVLQGRGTSDTAKVGPKEALNRQPGLYRVKVQYRSLADVPARLQIWWHGAGFSREPLPAWLLKHVAADVSAAGRQDDLAEQGRKAGERFGCSRCHSSAFPGSAAPPPGPSLADAGRRLNRTWLLHWLADPAKLRPDAHMPAQFSDDRAGFVERWLVADYLGVPADPKPVEPPRGDHRTGKEIFASLGCAACHLLPDLERGEQKDLDRQSLAGLADRLKADDLAAFLGNPRSRYPDGRMPRLPVTPGVAQDVAAYLLLWSKPAELEAAKPPTADEIAAVATRLKVRGAVNAAATLVREKRCSQCHPGIGPTQADDVPLKATDDARGCLSGKTTPRYRLDGSTAKALAAYRAVAAREQHASAFDSHRRLLDQAGCQRCHQRDSDRPPPLEEVGSTLGGARLQYVPFQRTPRLTNLHQKYNRAYLATAVREGVSGLRPSRYSYRMPAFGHDAEALLQALAEGDGELPAGGDPAQRLPDDPTVGTLAGPSLVGFTGYACVSCHVWNGQTLSEPDPGAVGPDLTRVHGRIRRDWFDRFLEDPGRVHPGTPMPGITPKGKPATLQSVLDGDPAKQRDALWAYLALGKDAPSPKPPPPLAVSAPAAGEAPLVAQIPIRLPAGGTVESITILFGRGDLLIYDLGATAPHSLFTGAQIVRNIQGRLRSYSAAGTMAGTLAADNPLQLAAADKSEMPKALTLHGYDRLADGARIRWQMEFAAGAVEVSETLRIPADQRRLLRELHVSGVPQGHQLVLRSRVLGSLAVDVQSNVGQALGSTTDGVFRARLTPDKKGTVAATIRSELPPAKAAPAIEKSALTDTGKIEGSLERPGYRAIAFPRPKTSNGDDLVMPAAVAAHPRDGRVFVASLKTGEIFVLRDPTGDGKQARFDNYAHGLFQEALSMRAEDDGLYVLHRRNLTRIVESKRDGTADRFERVFGLPHAITDAYDYGYGLVRDKTGAFVVSYAPHANRHLAGSGGLVRLLPGKEPKELAYGFRNPLGWCNGPDGDVFFTDNQGEWVATNKLSAIVEGRYYGYPNQLQKQHTTKPFAKPAVWVPYGWARSINGVTYDDTGGKFGPFAGQFFMAELMFGGAVVRANVEKVNGTYQGGCFPFWGKGLLGPLTLAFDPRGRLFVGGITEPGWMAQPDRGALFRIDFTGQTPFEMQSLHVLPRGFKVLFTTPVDPRTAGNPASYQVEHYRYEYTGAYGSPELDRTRVAIERIEVAADGRSAELTTTPLFKERVYLIAAPGVRSAKGEALVHAIGAYTLNEIPPARK